MTEEVADLVHLKATLEPARARLASPIMNVEVRIDIGHRIKSRLGAAHGAPLNEKGDSDSENHDAPQNGCIDMPDADAIQDCHDGGGDEERPCETAVKRPVAREVDEARRSQRGQGHGLPVSLQRGPGRAQQHARALQDEKHGSPKTHR